MNEKKNSKFEREDKTNGKPLLHHGFFYFFHQIFAMNIQKDSLLFFVVPCKYFDYAIQRTAKRIFIQRIFAFSAFFHLAPKCAQRQVSRSRRSKNVFFVPGKCFGKKMAVFRGKNRKFPRKIAIFRGKIGKMADFLRLRYHLAHDRFVSALRFQRIFSFSAFFSFSALQRKSALNENR